MTATAERPPLREALRGVAQPCSAALGFESVCERVE